MKQSAKKLAIAAIVVQIIAAIEVVWIMFSAGCH